MQVTENREQKQGHTGHFQKHKKFRNKNSRIFKNQKKTTHEENRTRAGQNSQTERW
uniref:Uncharacterized protein n=1 Tax=Anguilla anguilla TaxID=7936 RepID=A0A0E9XU57_ANGAN